MSLDEAFDEFQKTVDADPQQVELARERRDVFRNALDVEDDVVETFGSGSLQRRTQLRPIHDVDLVVLYDAGAHPGWGEPGNSAAEALDHARQRVNHLLGATNGVVDQVVRLARPRNHAVKCFIDDPDDHDAFHVDVMPALRQSEGHLLIPEKLGSTWVPADPQDLIRRVEDHQSAWSYFRPMVRLLKQWRLDVDVEGRIKSLVMEVLALECLPRAGNRPEALRAFFTAAAIRVNDPIVDPAGHCGAVQVDLDIAGLRTALEDAAELATTACSAAADGDTDGALRTWQKILGTDFPAPAPSPATPAVAAPPLVRPRPVRDAPQG